MKKIIYSAAAMALAFFAGSCQRENLEPVGGNTVTYTVQVPGAIATKSAESFVLTYEVYRAGEVGKSEKTPIYEGTEVFENDKAELSLEFVKDQNFVVLFWAQKEGAPYNINDLRKVSLTALTANDVKAEVFSGIDNVNNCESVKGGVVELVRPIAQLNVATLTSGLTVGTASSYSTVIPLTFNMTVNGLWSSYNVATGNVNESAGNISFAESGVSGGEFKTDYTLMGMNYIGFIPKDGTNVTVDFNIVTENDGTINHVVSNVPLKPNYRTNILGNLVSASDNYTVTLDEEWGDAGKDMVVLADGLVKNINGDYEVSSENGLAYAINTEFAKGGNFYLTEALYEMAGYDVNPPTSVSGSLNVYGEAPVVTRSAVVGVTITGLNITALIEEVAAGGSASFSNITIDSDTDFVGTNKGTIGFDNCTNKEGSEKEDLVGTNNGYVVDLQAEIGTLDDLQKAINTGVKEIVLTKTLVNKGEFELDLKGCNLSIVDATEANFELINNAGKLVIKNTSQKQAKMTVKATTDTGTSRYSAVIANTVGGDLTVQGNILLEHLGGTYMAYGIDNLTNGKETSAVVTIDGATVKSTYRAVRQFLNGIEATNELYVKSGSILEGPNKSIFFHDPSTKANSGKLVVEEGAELKGDVYLYVTEGSTQWPVSVSIASSTLMDGFEILTANLPVGYTVDEQEGAYVVNYKSPSQSRLEELIKNGGEVALNEDIQLSSALTIPVGTELVLDLNGKTITAGNDGYAIYNDGATLQIKDSQNCGSVTGIVYTENAVTTIEGGTYNPVEGGSYVILNSEGTLTINGATINACGTYPIYSYNEGNKLVINDVTINATFGCLNAYGNECEVVINGGTFQMTGVKGNTSHIAYFSQNAEVVINAGTFKKIGDLSMSATGGGGVCVNGKANLTINGGSFSGDYDDVYNYGGSISVKGGTYKFEPDFLAEGYEKVQNADKTWSVVKGQPNNEIWYTATEMKLEPTTPSALNANIVSNVWDNKTGKGVITFDAPLTAIGNEAFKRNTNTTPSNWMTSISLPKSVETIGSYAFAQCFSLVSITIPDSVTSIGQYAFQSCQAAINVTIGRNVKSIASGAFYGCWELKQIICKGTTPPTIADRWVFYDIASNPTCIVPAGSVDDYKAANFWSDLNIVAE